MTAMAVKYRFVLKYIVYFTNLLRVSDFKGSAMMVIGHENSINMRIVILLRMNLKYLKLTGQPLKNYMISNQRGSTVSHNLFYMYGWLLSSVTWNVIGGQNNIIIVGKHYHKCEKMFTSTTFAVCFWYACCMLQVRFVGKQHNILLKLQTVGLKVIMILSNLQYT